MNNDKFCRVGSIVNVYPQYRARATYGLILRGQTKGTFSFDGFVKAVSFFLDVAEYAVTVDAITELQSAYEFGLGAYPAVIEKNKYAVSPSPIPLARRQIAAAEDADGVQTEAQARAEVEVDAARGPRELLAGPFSPDYQYRISTSDTAAAVSLRFAVFGEPYEIAFLQQRMTRMFDLTVTAGGWPEEKQLNRQFMVSQGKYDFCRYYVNSTQALDPFYMNGLDCTALLDYSGPEIDTTGWPAMQNRTTTLRGPRGRRRLSRHGGEDSADADASALQTGTWAERQRRRNAIYRARRLDMNAVPMWRREQDAADRADKAVTGRNPNPLAEMFASSPSKAMRRLIEKTIDSEAATAHLAQAPTGRMFNRLLEWQWRSYTPGFDIDGLERYSFADILRQYMNFTSIQPATGIASEVDLTVVAPSSFNFPDVAILVDQPRGTPLEPLYATIAFPVQPRVLALDRHGRPSNGQGGELYVSVYMDPELYPDDTALLTGTRTVAINQYGVGQFIDLSFTTNFTTVQLFFDVKFRNTVRQETTVQVTSEVFTAHPLPPYLVVVVERELLPLVVILLLTFGTAAAIFGTIIYCTKRKRKRMEVGAEADAVKRKEYPDEKPTSFSPNDFALEEAVRKGGFIKPNQAFPKVPPPIYETQQVAKIMGLEPPKKKKKKWGRKNKEEVVDPNAPVPQPKAFVLAKAKMEAKLVSVEPENKALPTIAMRGDSRPGSAAAGRGRGRPSSAEDPRPSSADSRRPGSASRPASASLRAPARGILRTANSATAVRPLDDVGEEPSNVVRDISQQVSFADVDSDIGPSISQIHNR
jgi:hypothetical protein